MVGRSLNMAIGYFSYLTHVAQHLHIERQIHPKIDILTFHVLLLVFYIISHNH